MNTDPTLARDEGTPPTADAQACHYVLRLVVERLEKAQPCDVDDLIATVQAQHDRLAAAEAQGPDTQAFFDHSLDILHAWESAVRH